MPIYENACKTSDCGAHGRAFEWYASTANKPDPPCPDCGGPTARLISNFAVCWASDLSKYRDKNAQQQAFDAHTAWRIHSTRRADGQPEQVVIDSIQKQREYCKEEGLRNPSDINPNCTVSSDGMKMETAGVRGQWV